MLMLTANEVATLADAAGQDAGPVITFAAYSGLR
jgi:hypothetical protein